MELVDTTLSSIFSNKYASSAITLFLVLYGGLAAPKLPKFMVKLFENPIFKIVILSLIVYNGNRDPKFAIMIGVAFTVTLNMISNQKFLEGFDDIENFTETDMDDDDDEDFTENFTATTGASDDDDDEDGMEDFTEGSDAQADPSAATNEEECTAAGGNWDGIQCNA